MNLCLNRHFLTKNDLHGFTEVFLLTPFLSESVYTEFLVPYIGAHNESLFTKLFYSGKCLINSTDIENCDYRVVPFKYNEVDDRINKIILEANKHNKPLISFYCDDNAEKLSLDSNITLYRTSLYRSKQYSNERVFPALIPDQFCENYTCDNSVSFCGQLTQLRFDVIERIKYMNIKTDFIVRSGFWAPEISSKVKAKHEFNSNLLRSRYALCVRGVGNFSYRLYEALSFGRIPILIDTDTALPFSKIIDWNEHIIFIKKEEIELLPEIIKNDTRDMAKNRELWERYFSVEGYTSNLLKDI